MCIWEKADLKHRLYKCGTVCKNDGCGLIKPYSFYFFSMRFDIITVLPGLLESPFAHSILQRAQKKGLAEIHVHNLREYSTDKHKSVDDYPYGGGGGMVMTIEPFARCIEKLKAEREYDEVIFMTPDGKTLTQPI